MTIVVQSRRRSLDRLRAEYPDASIIDVTSKSEEPWVRFSSFYPHGDIPVPFSGSTTAEPVEGIWQGLKVFESEGVDVAKFGIRSMKGIKRSVRTRGKVLGHRKGIEGTEMLNYLAARRTIYLPSYRWVLDHRLQPEVEQLREMVGRGDVVLLDYEINGDVNDVKKPLSHAALVALYVEGHWPG